MKQASHIFAFPRRKCKTIGLFLLYAICSFGLASIWKFSFPSSRQTKTLLNISNFQYISIPKNACPYFKFNRKTILCSVHSARENFRSRQMIRQTYGSVKRFGNWNIHVVFLLGVAPKNEDLKTQQQLDVEIGKYEDILQGNFEDTYRNLSYKHVMGYKWAVESCPGIDYYIKGDDDTVINIFHVVRVLEYLNGKIGNLWYFCHIMTGMKPIRDVPENDPLKDWQVSYSEYPEEHYPTYCGFSAYLTTMEVVDTIYSISRFPRFLSMEDAFVTGVLREFATMHHHKLNSSRGVDFLPAKILDFGNDGKDGFIELKNSRYFLGVIVEERKSSIFCRVWRKIEEQYNFKKQTFGRCESLYKANID